jgi:hypothetical protein
MGLLMSAFSASYIVSALLTGKLFLKHMQRATGSYIGSVMLIFNITGLGCLYYIKDTDLIVSTAFVF